MHSPRSNSGAGEGTRTPLFGCRRRAPWRDFRRSAFRPTCRARGGREQASLDSAARSCPATARTAEPAIPRSCRGHPHSDRSLRRCRPEIRDWARCVLRRFSTQRRPADDLQVCFSTTMVPKPSLRKYHGKASPPEPANSLMIITFGPGLAPMGEERSWPWRRATGLRSV